MRQVQESIQESIEYLVGLENLAAGFYAEAAGYFAADQAFAAFLRNLEKDEIWHVQVMERAREHVKDAQTSVQPAISLDPIAVSELVKPIVESRRKLRAGELAKNELLACIIDVEFSEWNEIFLYVIDLLKERGLQFQGIAADLQGHKKDVEEFVCSLPECKHLLDRLEDLPSVWHERILIVDDEPTLLEALSAVLEREGQIETAANGREALEHVSVQYFDVILSDIDMPLMNGMEFYARAVRGDVGIRERFLFISGNPNATKLQFFSENKLPYLTKPASVSQIKEGVRGILEKSARSRNDRR